MANGAALPRGPSEGGNAPVRENVCGIRLGPARPCVLPALGSRPGPSAGTTRAASSLDTRERPTAAIGNGGAPGGRPVSLVRPYVRALWDARLLLVYTLLVSLT